MDVESHNVLLAWVEFCFDEPLNQNLLNSAKRLKLYIFLSDYDCETLLGFIFFEPLQKG